MEDKKKVHYRRNRCWREEFCVSWSRNIWFESKKKPVSKPHRSAISLLPKTFLLRDKILRQNLNLIGTVRCGLIVLSKIWRVSALKLKSFRFPTELNAMLRWNLSIFRRLRACWTIRWKLIPELEQFFLRLPDRCNWRAFEEQPGRNS